MSEPLPNPLVPTDCDVQNYPCLPLDIAKFFNDELNVITSDTQWRAAITVLIKSFHNVPAASIPDNDIFMARFAEFGRDIGSWMKVKDAVLKGWVKCNDGRYYHPAVAEKALEAWLSKIKSCKRGLAGSGTRWNKEIDFTDLDEKLNVAAECLKRLNPVSEQLTAGTDTDKSFEKKARKTKGINPIAESDIQLACKAVWNKYCEGYIARYGSKPIRDVKVNTQIKNIVKSLGMSDAPCVIEYYLKDNEAFYIKTYHSIGTFMANSSKLHTQWKTGLKVEATPGLAMGRRATAGLHTNLKAKDLKAGALENDKF